MTPFQIIFLIIAYFGVLILISYFTNQSGSNDEFFKANRQSPWYLVAFGMIGASLSGVTFISIPGTVEFDQFSYFQVVLGYTIGYAVISLVLLPLYYRLNLTSIYTYLGTRFGNHAYKTGAWFFILSRLVGASFRLFLVANVLQLLVFDQLNVPFYVTVSVTVFLIWLYTFKSGIKTIVWTDSLQTLFMLLALGVSIYFIAEDLGVNSQNMFNYLGNHEHFQVFFMEDVTSPNYFWKQFISGVFIAIVMTGLDQDMMQKNLTCRNLKDAQKNILWFTLTLTVVNFLFLSLGLLLIDYAELHEITAQRDELFPSIAASGDMGFAVAIFFVLGLIAAAYSSADSALTSLTTSFSIDILAIETKVKKSKQVIYRKLIHICISLVFIGVMMVFRYAIKDESVIIKLFEFAGYTYGPILAMFCIGMFTKFRPTDKLIPIVAIAAPVITYLISWWAKDSFNFEFGFFVLILNALICSIGLVLISLKHNQSTSA